VADFIGRIFFSRQANFQFLRVRFHSIRFREYSLLNVLKDSKKNFRQDKVEWFWKYSRILKHCVRSYYGKNTWSSRRSTRRGRRMIGWRRHTKPLVLESCAMWAWRGRLYRPSLYPMSPLLLLKGWPWRCMEKESGNRLLYQ